MSLEHLAGVPAKRPCFCQLFYGNRQFTYGVVREGVIAENVPQMFRDISATFHRISAPFRDAIKRILCKLPQTFRRISAKQQELSGTPACEPLFPAGCPRDTPCPEDFSFNFIWRFFAGEEAGNLWALSWVPSLTFGP